MISVTIGMPVAFLASSKSSSPSALSPWKSYGEVLGLKAPPRSSFAPLALTALATSIIWSRLSTEQGPAIKAKFPPPIFTPLTSTIVSSGWNFRLAFLYGSLIRVTDSIISSPLSRSISTLVVSPIKPRIVL